MITISSLFSYPVKSCAAVLHSTAVIGKRGIVLDREWMIVYESGHAVTQRKHPQMARICPEVHDHSLVLTMDGFAVAIPVEPVGDRFPGLKPASMDVLLWGKAYKVYPETPLADEHLSKFLGVNCILVRRAPVCRRRSRDGRASIAFPDGYPFLMVSEESLADLNERLIRPVPMDRFRPNIVVRGCRAYEEDEWKKVQIGDLILERAKRCIRCSIITVDQKTGEQSGGKLLSTLVTYRGEACFGSYYSHVGTGKVGVGDVLKVIR